MTFLSITIRLILFLCLIQVNTITVADDALFDDDLSFDVEGQEFSDFSDGSDVFEVDDSESKAYPGLGFKLSHKFSVDPTDNLKTTKQRTELTLDFNGILPQSGYGEMQIKAKRYWPNDSEYRTNTSDLEIERAFTQFSADSFSVKLGKYTIGWGEIEGGALDLVNPGGSLTDPFPKSQWLLSTTSYFKDSNLSTFYNPNPTINKIVNVALNSDTNSEFGLRFSTNNDGADSAFYYARLVPNSATKDIANGVSFANPYHLLGYSGNQTFQGNLIKYDIAYKSNLEHNRASNLVEVDRLDWGLALDIQQDDMPIVFSMNSQHLIDYFPDLLTPSLIQNVSTSKNNFSYSINVNDSFDDEDFKWSVAASSNYNGDMNLLSAGIDWDIDDQWSSSIRGTRISAPSDRAFSYLDGYESIDVELNYQY